MSVYRTIIDNTSETLTLRTKHYRWLVISFITIGLVSLFVVIVTMSLRPLSGLLLLLPAYALYLFFDNKVLKHWRTEITDAWKTMAIDLDAMRQALMANKALPQQTMDGMLETLPQAGDLLTEQSVSISTRHALAKVVDARDTYLNYKLLGKMVSYTIVVIAVIGVALTNNWFLVISIVLVPTTHLFYRWYSQRYLYRAIDQIEKIREESDFDADKYKEIVNLLSWYDASVDLKERLLDTMAIEYPKNT